MNIEERVNELDEHTTIQMELIRELTDRVRKIEELILSMTELMKNSDVKNHYLTNEELEKREY